MSDQQVPVTTRKLPFRSRLLRGLFILARDLLFNVQVVGRDNIPAQNAIVVANHLSWIDHLLIWTILPAEPRLYLLGAGQSDNSGFKHWLLKTFGGIIVFERGAHWVGKDTLLRPIRTLEEGASLLVFPEAKAGPKEGEILPLNRGVGHFVLRAPANCPILPIALSGVQELYWRKKMMVVVGRPFRVETAGQQGHAAIDAAMAQVEASLRETLPAYHEPAVRIKLLRFLTDLSDRL